MKIESQNKAIRKALEAGETLTAMDALRRFGSNRLAARIYDLKQSGMKITRNMVCKNGKRVAEYVRAQA